MNEAQLDRAMKIALKLKHCGASHFQRELYVGYAEAMRIVERLQDVGVLGDYVPKHGYIVHQTGEDWTLGCTKD